jgi:DNA-damage-inducible protein D
MASNEQTPQVSPFDAILEVDEMGKERWSARALHKILGYTEWRNFNNVVIKRAMKACEENGEGVSEHFVQSYKMSKTGQGGQRKTEDFLLSRYGAYLTVMNGDPHLPVVALGQAYFAVQTRRQELSDELALQQLNEDEKRLVLRREMSILNQRLADAARKAGVIKPEHFATFNDHGYMGLYNGLRENDIHTRKHLRPKEKILDFMGSDESAANAFRASLTRQKIEREQIQDRHQANMAHFEMGKEVRQTIIRAGATLPEDLPTPEKSIQQLQREEQKRLDQSKQPSLFELEEEQ